jgi:hypothetical protein
MTKNDRRNPSGLLVLSSARKVIYANNVAHDLLGEWSNDESRVAADRLPKAVEDWLEHRGWIRCVAKRLVRPLGQSVVIQAFSGPQNPDAHRSFIVLTLQ